MFFRRAKSKNTPQPDFYIGNVPTRPGRRQINLDRPIAPDKLSGDSTRIGGFSATSGYHPVRPAIMINDGNETQSSPIKPFSTSQLIPDSSEEVKRHSFFHRRRKG